MLFCASFQSIEQLELISNHTDPWQMTPGDTATVRWAATIPPEAKGKLIGAYMALSSNDRTNSQ